MVHRAGGAEPYIVQLVSSDGRGGPSVSPTSRSDKFFYFPPPPTPCGMCSSAESGSFNLPETSISSTRVYFLDGETQVKSLSPDGTVASVMNLSAPANTEVVFAVSPDDRRIAVSAITLATDNSIAPINEVMYVEDVGTGSNRVDIYTTTTIAEWPVAWHGGSLVVGVGPVDISTYENPYGAVAYHIVDPATGRRLLALNCAQGLLGPAGTACATGFCGTASTCAGGTIGEEGWNGATTNFALPVGPPPKILLAFAHGAELSPDGRRIAAFGVMDSPSFAPETIMLSNGASSVLTQLGSPQGWLDSTHLVVTSGTAAWIVDADNGQTATQMTGISALPQEGSPALAGVLPTNLA